MQSCKLFGTSRLAGGFLFIQKNRLLVQAAFCLIHVNRQKLSYRQSTCDQTVTTVGQVSSSLVRSL